jgi:acyl-CoA carboxylase subunit beta
MSPGCPQCGTSTDDDWLRAHCYVCDCGHHIRIPPEAWIALLADPGTWRESWTELRPHDFLGWLEPVPYDELIAGNSRDGRDEAVRVGRCSVGGHPVWLGLFDFRFMGGTLGVVAGERLARALEHATASRLPFIAVVASGGARMQEGTLALMQMAKVNATVRLLQDAAVPFFSILTDPTFGGTSASLALAADVNIAEPGSSIGFSGARVIEQATFTRLPPDFQTAEFQLAHGQVDMVVPRPEMWATLVDLLGLYTSGASMTGAPRCPAAAPGLHAPVLHAPVRSELRDGMVGWEAVELARHPERPYASDYVMRWSEPFVELHGDRLHGDDPAVLAGVARWNGAVVTFLGQQKARTFAERVRRNFGMMHAEGYRKAIRLARQAARFGFPVVVLIDTPGAYPGTAAEEGGIAGAIGTALTEWFRIDTPVVAVVIGEGGSGGALGMGVADRVLILEHAIYAVASPEAAASIVWRDSARKATAAGQLHVTAQDMLRLGIADAVVREPPGGAHRDHDDAARLLGAAVQESLREVCDMSSTERLTRRHRRFRAMGSTVLRPHLAALSDSG